MSTDTSKRLSARFFTALLDPTISCEADAAARAAIESLAHGWTNCPGVDTAAVVGDIDQLIGHLHSYKILVEGRLEDNEPISHPLRISDHDHQERVIIVADIQNGDRKGYHIPVATVQPLDGTNGRRSGGPRTEATARLFEKAPELYRLCKKRLLDVEDDTDATEAALLTVLAYIADSQGVALEEAPV